MALISKGRVKDMEMLRTLLECAEVGYRLGKTEIADETMAVADKFRARINTHDYKKEDEDWAIVDELDRRWNELSKGKL